MISRTQHRIRHHAITPSRHHLERLGIQRLPIGHSILVTIDALGDPVELTSVGKGVAGLFANSPRRCD